MYNYFSQLNYPFFYSPYAKGKMLRNMNQDIVSLENLDFDATTFNISESELFSYNLKI